MFEYGQIPLHIVDPIDQFFRQALIIGIDVPNPDELEPNREEHA
jgi:hypothetical protein